MGFIVVMITEIPRKIVLGLIRIYQKTLSPDHGFFKSLFPGGYCKYTPSCSEYMRQAVEKFGILRGGAKGLYRLIRCNPCSRGGMDVP